MKKILILVSLMIIAGCVPSYELLKSGDTKMWNAYTVSTPENINEMKLDGLVSWTKYGPLLEQIRFLKPIGEGDKIPFIYSSENESKVPTYRSGMTPEEVVELYRSSNTLGGTIVTAISELEPVNLGGGQGYTFVASLSSPKGKDYKSKVYFTEHEQKLYMIEFGAHATHYFEHRQDFVQDVVTSIKF
ncbi:hypothetical protein [Sneathiella glossodoripedis]|uniref:hypothetical protein n=1 Tax=Sneathiella glossodoripedis TaxID=418853 RepID=UPI00046F906D|nr:hypothetical protein [Sneathiella glossodoripedis]